MNDENASFRYGLHFNKDVVIKGAQYGVDARIRSLNVSGVDPEETTIKFTGAMYSGILQYSNMLELNGFTFIGAINNNHNRLISSRSLQNNIVLKVSNCIFKDINNAGGFVYLIDVHTKVSVIIN